MNISLAESMMLPAEEQAHQELQCQVVVVQQVQHQELPLQQAHGDQPKYQVVVQPLKKLKLKV